MSKTVKVRIAVVVGEDGEWNSHGRSNWKPQNNMEMAESFYSAGKNRKYFWLEADLPLPETPTVQAKVEKAE